MIKHNSKETHARKIGDSCVEVVFSFSNDRHHAIILADSDSPASVASRLHVLAAAIEADPKLND